MTSDVTIASALNAQQKTQAAKNGLATDFSDFLSLLTVQLQNQDPLSPMETNEFTNQLVAFTGVEQQINTNQKLDDLVAMELGQSYSSSLDYVGKNVSYISSELSYTGSPAEVRYSLSEPAAYSQILVKDEGGNVVYKTDGAKTSGAHSFVWNGETNYGTQAAPGTYEIVVDALNGQEEPIEATTVVQGKVRGAESQNGQIFLLVGERAVAMSNVLNTSVDSVSDNNSALTSALSYVGLDVSYLNDSIYHDAGDPITHNIIYDLKKEAERAKLIVKNDQGETVHVSDVDTDAGQNITSWDGRLNNGDYAPTGNYSFTIDAIDANDQRISYSSVSEGQVTGVESENGLIYLNIGEKRISLDKVIQANVANNGS